MNQTGTWQAGMQLGAQPAQPAKRASCMLQVAVAAGPHAVRRASATRMACHCNNAAVTATDPMTYLQGRCEQDGVRTWLAAGTETGTCCRAAGRLPVAATTCRHSQQALPCQCSYACNIAASGYTAAAAMFRQISAHPYSAGSPSSAACLRPTLRWARLRCGWRAAAGAFRLHRRP
jgi:hypothetical protein